MEELNGDYQLADNQQIMVNREVRNEMEEAREEQKTHKLTWTYAELD